MVATSLPIYMIDKTDISVVASIALWVTSESKAHPGLLAYLETILSTSVRQDS